MDPLDCLVIHCVVLAAWDDQADVEDLEEDLTCARPVELEVLDQARMLRMHHTEWMRCTIVSTSCNHSTCSDIASH